jgi:hypothetical protein
MIRRNINFEERHYEKLRKMAFESHTNFSEIVRRAVESYTARNDKELGTIVPVKRKEKDGRS